MPSRRRADKPLVLGPPTYSLRLALQNLPKVGEKDDTRLIRSSGGQRIPGFRKVDSSCSTWLRLASRYENTLGLVGGIVVRVDGY